jgi:hypothetical protein
LYSEREDLNLIASLAFLNAVLALALLNLIVAVGVVLVLGILLAYVFTAAVGRQVANRVTNQQVFDCSFTKSPPATLSSATVVTYNVMEKTVRTVGAGPGIAIGPPKAWQGADITFKVGGNSTVDGALEKTVRTDPSGNASVTLAPIRNGQDALDVHVEIGTAKGDETPQRYETVK